MLGLILLYWFWKPGEFVNAAFIGVIGHFGKFLVKWAFGVISGAPVGFVALGLGKALISYLVFGALGGILGGLTISHLRKLVILRIWQKKNKP